MKSTRAPKLELTKKELSVIKDLLIIADNAIAEFNDTNVEKSKLDYEDWISIQTFLRSIINSSTKENNV